MKTFDNLTKFLEGIGSIICLYPKENRREIKLPSSSICGALKEDWKKVGLDMWKAYHVVDSQHLETKQHRGKDDRFERSPRQYP
ncbi:MAG TPA: hypothetical protein VHZ76_05060 [Gammaproteobacteria bacterium]|jgi:hypothetical protein|nr:hypothetical protein [Gammaproteobacteria bacterium]